MYKFTLPCIGIFPSLQSAKEIGSIEGMTNVNGCRRGFNNTV